MQILLRETDHLIYECRNIQHISFVLPWCKMPSRVRKLDGMFLFSSCRNSRQLSELCLQYHCRRLLDQKESWPPAESSEKSCKEDEASHYWRTRRELVWGGVAPVVKVAEAVGRVVIVVPEKASQLPTSTTKTLESSKYLYTSSSSILLWTYWPSFTSLFAGRQPSYLSAGMSILSSIDNNYWYGDLCRESYV